MKEVSVAELKQKIDNNEDFQLIDVRESFEYEVSNLGGLNIPLAGIVIEAEKISKDKPVIIQCRSGKRSAQAVMALLSNRDLIIWQTFREQVRRKTRTPPGGPGEDCDNNKE
ncbi:hypothetical protein FQR65_LT18029 [Abscondita terminalis]|nr:hypothetical protein FQR65_LT18029 [Abscondita terminalis]